MTGNALRRARAFLGYTQDEMAQALGLSLSTYQRRERLGDDYLPISEATHASVLVAYEAVGRLEEVEE